jgi:hypothetical protein
LETGISFCGAASVVAGKLHGFKIYYLVVRVHLRCFARILFLVGHHQTRNERGDKYSISVLSSTMNLAVVRQTMLTLFFRSIGGHKRQDIVCVARLGFSFLQRFVPLATRAAVLSVSDSDSERRSFRLVKGVVLSAGPLQVG